MGASSNRSSKAPSPASALKLRSAWVMGTSHRKACVPVLPRADLKVGAEEVGQADQPVITQIRVARGRPMGTMWPWSSRSHGRQTPLRRRAGCILRAAMSAAYPKGGSGKKRRIQRPAPEPLRTEKALHVA